MKPDLAHERIIVLFSILAYDGGGVTVTWIEFGKRSLPFLSLDTDTTYSYVLHTVFVFADGESTGNVVQEQAGG